jgi:hypothetical protein
MFRKKKQGKRLYNKNIQQGGDAIKKYTPLIEAIRARDVNKVRKFLDLGVNPNEKDNIEGWSPMKWIHYMYLHGENRDSEDNQRACLDIINLLLEKGVNMVSDYDDQLNNVYIFASAPPLEENENNNNLQRGGKSTEEYTPLIKAIRERNVNMVQDLLRAGANPNQKDDSERWSPMKWNNYNYLYGLDHNNENNKRLDNRITELLVQHGANMMDFDNMNNFTYDFSLLVQNQNRGVRNNYNNMNTGGRHKRKSKKNRKSMKSRKLYKKRKQKTRKH